MKIIPHKLRRRAGQAGRDSTDCALCGVVAALLVDVDWEVFEVNEEADVVPPSRALVLVLLREGEAVRHAGREASAPTLV